MFSKISFFLACTTLIFQSVTNGQTLEAVKARVGFSIPKWGIVGTYAGGGKIYLVGGSNVNLYDITTDTLTLIGHLPTSASSHSLAIDSRNYIYIFGMGSRGDIYRFNTTSMESDIVGRLPQDMNTIGTVQPSPETALVFGSAGNVVEIDLNTYVVNELGYLGVSSQALAWDGKDSVFLFHTSQHRIYSISGNNYTNFTNPEPHNFQSPSVISTGTSAWIVGNYGGTVGRGNCLVEVNFSTLAFSFWTVENYPAASNNSVFYHVAVAYVPELHRLYTFGGATDPPSLSRHEIFYIDLPQEATNTVPDIIEP